ncbi:MAG: glycosyltransferase family 9 protein [Selenomonas ruminantium]|nr:glycosyltransferase family 9 protein [Selenomonas ruminantium]
MNKKLSVGFRLNGGIGTYIAELNFIKHFYDKFADNVLITIYGSTIEEVNDGLMYGQDFIHSYYERRYYEKDKYDLAIDINWFPKIEKIDWKKIEQVPELFNVVEAWQAFADNHYTSIYASGNPIYESNIYTYATVNGKNRLDVMDIDGLLGIGRYLRFALKVSDDAEDILRNFGLLGKKYITINSGVNAANKTRQSPKQWPIENYIKFCRMMKKKYPDIVLVQLGESAGSLALPGVDSCLLDKTDFEELKVILKNSCIHVDGDCGMVHIRKALHTRPSIVLFGQTPASIHGYDDDIVLTASVCKENCAKVFAAWKRKCLRGDVPTCMAAITPEMVMENIVKYFTNSQGGGNILP